MKKETLCVLITNKCILVLLSTEAKWNINSVNIKQIKKDIQQAHKFGG